jgi:hypothetical protein
MRLVEWIKQRQVYHSIKQQLAQIKQRIRQWLQQIRLQIKTKHGLMHRLKRRYKFIRRKLLGNPR